MAEIDGVDAPLQREVGDLVCLLLGKQLHHGARFGHIESFHLLLSQGRGAEHQQTHHHVA